MASRSRDPIIGKVIDSRFKVTKRIAGGGMGAVYKAQSLEHSESDESPTDVAIKVMLPALADNSEFIQRFRRECKVAAMLTHPNAVRLWEAGKTRDGMMFMVMEYVPGEDLKELIAREAPLSEERTIDITRQIIGVLAEAHGMGIVHRDLKPKNIKVINDDDRNDFVKVFDFGIAKIKETVKLTRPGYAFGTPEYMSPEQCRGFQDIDHRADIYSLAIIVYEMLSGRLPIKSDTPRGFPLKQLHAKPTPLRELRQLSVSAALDEAIEKALEKDRNKRQHSVQNFLAELEFHESEQPPQDEMPALERSEGPKAGWIGPLRNIVRGWRRAPETMADDTTTGRLVVVEGDTTGQHYDLSDSTTYIGGIPRSDIIVPGEEDSGPHARIDNNKGEFVLYDLRNDSGIFVNDQAIERRVLRDGDKIKVRDSSFIFEIAPGESQTSGSDHPHPSKFCVMCGGRISSARARYCGWCGHEIGAPAM